MTNAWGASGVQTVNASGSLVPQAFVATAGQTLFPITAFQYVQGSNSLLVFVNGQLQTVNLDYTETSTSSFTLANACSVNDNVVCIGFPLASIIQPSGAFATQTGQTASFIMPAGTTAQQDAVPVAGYTRWNTTLSALQTWVGATLGWLSAVFSTGPNGSLINPSGTTAQRDAAPQFGWQRANSSTTQMEWFNGTAWTAMGGGATGGGQDQVFVLNGNTINNSFTIPAGQNAHTVGPVTIATGKVISIATGSVWRF